MSGPEVRVAAALPRLVGAAGPPGDLAMRVVALFRVSTEKQASEGASLDAQERLYREIAGR